jgi:hypothetical protein
LTAPSNPGIEEKYLPFSIGTLSRSKLDARAQHHSAVPRSGGDLAIDGGQDAGAVGIGRPGRLLRIGPSTRTPVWFSTSTLRAMPLRLFDQVLALRSVLWAKS